MLMRVNVCVPLCIMTPTYTHRIMKNDNDVPKTNDVVTIERTIKCSFNETAKKAKRTITYTLRVVMDDVHVAFEQCAKNVAILDQRAVRVGANDESAFNEIGGTVRTVYVSEIVGRAAVDPKRAIMSNWAKMSDDEKSEFIASVTA